MSTETQAPFSQQPTGATGPKDAEYAAIAEKAEAARAEAEAQNQPKSDIPEPLLAGKFKSSQELEKAYIELQSKLGGPKKEEAKTDVPAGAKSLTPEMFDSYTEEYVKSGQLSDKSYEALEKMGVSRSLVDSYIEGRKVAAERQESAIMDEVGGRDNYKQIIEWASQSLPADDIQQYNEIVQSGDPKKAAFAAKALAARFRSESSQPPARMIDGKRVNSDAGFSSRAEMVEAMQNPKYQKDPAYREQVIRRIANSNF
jgi:hypothetical protein